LLCYWNVVRGVVVLLECCAGCCCVIGMLCGVLLCYLNVVRGAATRTPLHLPPRTIFKWHTTTKHSDMLLCYLNVVLKWHTTTKRHSDNITTYLSGKCKQVRIVAVLMRRICCLMRRMCCRFFLWMCCCVLLLFFLIKECLLRSNLSKRSKKHSNRKTFECCAGREM